MVWRFLGSYVDSVDSPVYIKKIKIKAHIISRAHEVKIFVHI